MLKQGCQVRGGVRGVEIPRRAFTLIEVLISLAILVALTGLLWPATQGWMDSARFRETAAQLPGVLASVRADVRRDGIPCRVVARSTGGVETLMVERIESVAKPDEAERPQAASASTGSKGRKVMELPSGCAIVRATSDGASQEQGREGDEARRDEVDAGDGVTLVVFLPDGSAISAEEVSFTGSGGRSIPLIFDRWTGRARLGAQGASAPGTARAGADSGGARGNPTDAAPNDAAPKAGGL